MCGRFYIAAEDTEGELRAIIDTLQRKTGMPLKTGEIRPTDIAPVIANSRELKPAPFAMKWGYSLPSGKLLINARSETAMEKPMFHEGMERHRCLIPATHYFEWEHAGGQKIKNEIKPTGSSLMYMAGLYRIEQGKPVFTILTRERQRVFAISTTGCLLFCQRMRMMIGLIYLIMRTMFCERLYWIWNTYRKSSASAEVIGMQGIISLR